MQCSAHSPQDLYETHYLPQITDPPPRRLTRSTAIQFRHVAKRDRSTTAEEGSFSKRMRTTSGKVSDATLFHQVKEISNTLIERTERLVRAFIKKQPEKANIDALDGKLHFLVSAQISAGKLPEAIQSISLFGNHKAKMGFLSEVVRVYAKSGNLKHARIIISVHDKAKKHISYY